MTSRRSSFSFLIGILLILPSDADARKKRAEENTAFAASMAGVMTREERVARLVKELVPLNHCKASSDCMPTDLDAGCGGCGVLIHKDEWDKYWSLKSIAKIPKGPAMICDLTTGHYAKCVGGKCECVPMPAPNY